MAHGTDAVKGVINQAISDIGSGGVDAKHEMNRLVWYLGCEVSQCKSEPANSERTVGAAEFYRGCQSWSEISNSAPSLNS